MRKETILLILVLSVLLSACTEPETIEQQLPEKVEQQLPEKVEQQQAETVESKVQTESLDINLSKQTFKEIYNIPDTFFVDDAFIHDNPGSSPGSNEGIVERSPHSDKGYNAFHEILLTECISSTINDITVVENDYDYILDFNLNHSEAHMSFSISIGESYLLVSLIGETEKIIKHEISEESYKKLLDLLYVEPDLGMEVVAENMVRATDKIPIIPDGSGNYLKYLMLHDSDLNRIPLLVRVELKINDLGKSKPVMESVKAMRIEFLGTTSVTTLGELSDGNAYWEKNFSLDNDESISTLPRKRLPEIEYLKANYSEVRLWDKLDDVITYSSSYPLDGYTVSIGIGRDPVSEEFYLSVNDNK